VGASCGNESSEPDIEAANHDHLRGDRTFVGRNRLIEAPGHRLMPAAPITLTRASASLHATLVSLSVHLHQVSANSHLLSRHLAAACASAELI
jgi:hypothetical protein